MILKQTEICTLLNDRIVRLCLIRKKGVYFVMVKAEGFPDMSVSKYQSVVDAFYDYKARLWLQNQPVEG